ncbi:uncharacterized protein LOC122021927 isoform X1 [Zingiber officinale]|uniref:uncharacterized protein LOC122021927 isoform X1 n=1 Tax=Zingiber officinale TaxID=94328 RepID=UPI001C4B26A2|nr:uncharacterized protein LOC122021927 isoform X1 [Zingiber officinale]
MAGAVMALPRTAARGFSVQMPVAVERPCFGSFLVPCDPGEGGVQVTTFLLSGFQVGPLEDCMDEEGDMADEFLSVATEILPDENQTAPHKLHTVLLP